MKKSLCALTCIASLGLLSLRAAESESPRLTDYQITKLKVVKVYYAKDGDAVFRAYAVKWKGQEVIASDDLALTHYKVGDTINVMVITSPTHNGEGKHGIMQFRTSPYYKDPQPNPQGGANGRQPLRSETNGRSAVAAPRHSP
jgi:hypothetical protein